MNYLKPLLVVAGIMLLLAIAPGWPYAYYQLMRVVVFVAAVVGAYHAFKSNRSGWVWLLGAAAVLFNPIAPIHMDKESWVLSDLIGAVVMFLAAAKLKQQS